MAALLAGKTVVNLNYTASAEAIEAALDAADIQTVYSSRLFLKKLEQKGMAVEDYFFWRAPALSRRHESQYPALSNGFGCLDAITARTLAVSLVQQKTSSLR
jgi:acyl-CoA synthetase (AMP-forming)/AMP-acid ligase II